MDAKALLVIGSVLAIALVKTSHAQGSLSSDAIPVSSVLIPVFPVQASASSMSDSTLIGRIPVSSVLIPVFPVQASASSMSGHASPIGVPNSSSTTPVPQVASVQASASSISVMPTPSAGLMTNEPPTEPKSTTPHKQPTTGEPETTTAKPQPTTAEKPTTAEQQTTPKGTSAEIEWKWVILGIALPVALVLCIVLVVVCYRKTKRRRTVRIEHGKSPDKEGLEMVDE